MDVQQNRLNKRTIFFLSSFNFFVFGTIAILMTFFPVYLQQSLGYNKSAVGMIMAAGPVISVIANPFWGYWSDRTQNIRGTLLILLVGNLALIQFVFQMQAYVWIYVGMLLFFWFQTPTFSQSTSLILNSIEGTSHRFGSFRSWGSVGWALAAVGAAPVIGMIGIDHLVWVYSSLMLVTLVMCFYLPKSEASTRTAMRMNSSGGLRNMLKNRFFISFLMISVFVSIPNSLNGMFAGLYVTDLGGSPSLVGMSVFMSAFFEVPVFLLLDRYLRKEKKYMISLLVIVCLLYALRWVLMSLADQAWQVVLIQMMQCITYGLFFYVGTNLTTLIVPPEYRATGQSLYTISWNGISGMIAGFLGGALLDVWGYQRVYGIGAGLAFASAVLFLVIRLWPARLSLKLD